MTLDENKLVLDHWSIKKRGADGKRRRPCDDVLTAEETAQVLKLPRAEQRTAAALRAAQQAAHANIAEGA